MAVPGNLLLRRLLARRPSWKWIKARRGRFTLLSMLVVAGLVGWLTYDLSRPAQLGIWAGVLVFFAFIVRLRWLTFFGPVFLYDLVRSARRSNFAALRSFYAGALLVVLFMVYSSVVRMRGSTFWETLWKPGAVPPESGARFGESVFYTFAAVQFVAVMLLTPVCAAGAITEEKERRTLEFVLTTDLSDREVIFGKLASRMAYLVLFMLTGLPVLSLLQFMGGVAPSLVFASFIMTGLTMMSVACLSVAVSVFVNKTRSAVLLTYLITISYLLVSSCCCALPLPWLTAGNFLIAVRRLLLEGNPEDNLLGVLIEYSVVHGIACVGCYFWAAVNLRPRSEKQPSGVIVMREPARLSPPPVRSSPAVNSAASGRTETPQRPRARHMVYPQADLPTKPRPRVSDRPILWKEFHEPFFRPGPAGQTLFMVFGVMGLLMGGYVLLLGMAAAASSSSLGAFTNLVVRYFGTAVACFMFVGVGLRAASTFTGERDRQTLDSLLTTLVENKAIVYGKWMGSILGVRKLWFVLAPLWGLALLAGGLNPLALILLALGWCVFAAFEAGLGMCLSLLCRSTLVASVATVLTSLGLCACPWAVWSLYASVAYQGNPPSDVTWVQQFVVHALTPPATLFTLSFHTEDFALHSDTWQLVAYAICGLGCYAVLAALLWQALVAAFPRATGRMPVRRTGIAIRAQPDEAT